MAEISALKLNNNRALIENTKKLLACSSFEEETDSSESGESRSSAKGVDFITSNLLHAFSDNRCITVLIKFLSEAGGTLHGHFETFSPPPDILA